jgi:hypothetical protein
MFEWEPLGLMEIVSLLGTIFVFIVAIVKIRDVIRDLVKTVAEVNAIVLKHSARIEVLERITGQHGVILGNVELAIIEEDVDTPSFDRRRIERRKLRRIFNPDHFKTDVNS